MFYKRLLLAPVSLLLVLACGADQQQIIKSFSYNINDNVISFALQFNQNIELNTEFTIPILNYGSISLTPPANGTGFIIGGTLNTNYINDGKVATLSKTRNLPDGQPMTNYVTQDLAQIRIKDTDQIYSDIYLGLDTDHMYLGTALELGYIDQYFPAGLVISVRIPDQQHRTVGVITIFGPEVKNGELIAPGGFFFVTNISDLIKYYPRGKTIHPAMGNANESIMDVVENNEPYRREYSDPFKMMRLLQDIKKAGQDAGYVDR